MRKLAPTGAPRGERLVGYAPHGHWKTITFVGGLRQRGMTAPFVLKGAINGPMFLAYVKQCLVPTLKRGEIVLMDHLPVHKVAGGGEAIEAADATLIFFRSICNRKNAGTSFAMPAMLEYHRNPL
jgi:hypothetical protein